MKTRHRELERQTINAICFKFNQFLYIFSTSITKVPCFMHVPSPEEQKLHPTEVTVTLSFRYV